jgi:hypothetical protein
MLIDVPMIALSSSSTRRISSGRSPCSRSKLPLTLSLALFLPLAIAAPVLLAGCNRAAAGTPITTASPQTVESARQQLDLIPPPSKSRYMAIHSLSTWENPYLTVQENIATLHVTQSDANQPEQNAGGTMQPVALRQQNLSVRVCDLPAALNALPADSWPYGRVVAIEEEHNAPAASRPAVRRNVEATLKTLGDLGVVVYEWNDGSSGLR